MIVVIVVFGVVGVFICVAVRGWIGGLQQQVDDLKKRVVALSLEVTQVRGQLAVEQVLPLWHERYVNGAVHLGVVDNGLGRRRRLLSARVEELERMVHKLLRSGGAPTGGESDMVATLKLVIAELEIRRGQRGDTASACESTGTALVRREEGTQVSRDRR
jgi:hypothetical protein